MELGGALIRSAPEDFRVDELPLYPPAGEGGHTFLRVEKCLRSTEEVARDLARAAGVAPREVGYAGRKDRVAVATQWFSVPGLVASEALALALPGVRVLEAAAHPHKLRTGQLRGNRFDILVRRVDDALCASAHARWDRLRQRGLPNRFGLQRFGREGDNADAGARVLAGELRMRDRRRARFLLSALQARCFNAALEARRTPLDLLELGDVAVVHASGGRFRVEDLGREAPRAAAFEISATGPIFGTRVSPSPTGEVAEREGRVLEAHGVPVGDLRPPRGIRLRGARRPLRVPLADARFERVGEDLRLGFTLPAGSYATVLLQELLAPPAG